MRLEGKRQCACEVMFSAPELDLEEVTAEVRRSILPNLFRAQSFEHKMLSFFRHLPELMHPTTILTFLPCSLNRSWSL